MSNSYKRLGIDLLATGGTDIRVKTRISDSNSGFLDDKIQPAVSGKITKSIGNPFGNETLLLDIDDTLIDHDLLLNFEDTEHRVQDDLQTTNSTLWSSQKVQDELDEKVNRISPVADNRLLKSVGTTGVDMEQTAITVDDSGNVSGVQDLIVSGNLTVDGTTTSVNSAILEVADSNIEVNKDGTQASANLNIAGLTVDMSDATNAILGYDSSLVSKFKIGEAGDLREIVSTTHTQSLLNKTIDADSNTLSNIELDNFKAGVIDLDDTLASADDTKVPTSLTVKTYVDGKVAEKDEASEISYDNATSGLTGDNVQDVVDELSQEKADVFGSQTENRLTKYNASQQLIDSLILEDSALVAINSNDTTFNLKVNSNTNDSAFHLTNLTSGETVSDGLVFRLTNDIAQVDNKEGGSTQFISGGNQLLEINQDGTIEAKTTDYTSLVVSNNVLTNKEYVDDRIVELAGQVSAGDIGETSFTATAGATDADVTDFILPSASVRSFMGLVSVERDADSDLFETFVLNGVNIGGDWQLSYESTGEDSSVTFDITALGQVTYSDTAIPVGHNSTIIKFRAITTSV